MKKINFGVRIGELGNPVTKAGTVLALRNTRAGAFVALALLLSLSLSCASIRKDPATGQPPREPTPFEQVLALNYSLAATNDLVQQGVIAAEKTGVLPTPITADVVKMTRQIAQADKELTKILELGQAAASGRAAEINALIQGIRLGANALALNGSLGIKNPNSQATFQAQANAMAVLAERIVELLQQTGVIQ